MNITTLSGSREYTVARIGKLWYPVHVVRDYSAPYQEGRLHLWPVLEEDGADRVYARRIDALTVCRQQVKELDTLEQSRWESLAARTDLEPERCGHYEQIIEEITGSPPRVEEHPWVVIVDTSAYPCLRCGNVHQECFAVGYSRQEVLSRVAEWVYRDAANCLARPVSQQEGTRHEARSSEKA